MKIKYQIFNPAGNITALVIGDKYTHDERKQINNMIMDRNKEVEQVGFLSEDKAKLTMAGGEFCGNATRCATYYYLNEKIIDEIEINKRKIKVGKDKLENIWCEIPIDNYNINKLEDELYKVILDGITIIVARKILEKDYSEEELKVKAREIVNSYDDEINNAIGVMFLNKKDNEIKINPIVFVKTINTIFYENACGSGTIAVTMLDAILLNKSNKYIIWQPSGEILETDITVENGKVLKAVLRGEIITNNEVSEFEI